MNYQFETSKLTLNQLFDLQNKYMLLWLVFLQPLVVTSPVNSELQAQAGECESVIIVPSRSPGGEGHPFLGPVLRLIRIRRLS